LTAPAASLICSRFTVASSENRIICRDAAVSGCIALMTCEGSSESARQAEPDDAQMPCLSSRMSSASDSMPWNVMLAVLVALL